MSPCPIVKFTYKNYKGEVSTRTVFPKELFFGSTKWHPEAQFLLRGLDFDKGAIRDFAMKDISQWRPVTLVEYQKLGSQSRPDLTAEIEAIKAIIINAFGLTEEELKGHTHRGTPEKGISYSYQPPKESKEEITYPILDVIEEIPVVPTRLPIVTAEGIKRFLELETVGYCRPIGIENHQWIGIGHEAAEAVGRPRETMVCARCHVFGH